MTDGFAIWSWEHRAWWRARRQGYTLNPADAGIYTFQEAAEIVVGHRPPGREVAVDLHAALRGAPSNPAEENPGRRPPLAKERVDALIRERVRTSGPMLMREIGYLSITRSDLREDDGSLSAVEVLHADVIAALDAREAS
jgi:hypothetical protein